jgi:hypothetical protein
MANPEHLKILKEGIRVWNQWANGNPRIRPDLSGADLQGINTSDWLLRGANLTETNLSGAKLLRADLRETDLKRTNLEYAHLAFADLTAARLNRTDFTHASLWGANLSETYIDGALFHRTELCFTIIAFTSLKTVEGLDTCVHTAPCSIDYRTLHDSGPLPDVFLKGIGLPDDYIDYLRVAWCNPIEFFSCFISYSHADKSFARRLHDTLQGRGIRCWLDEHEILPGQKIHRVVDEALRLHDKVLLCASESSLKSWWVDHELQKALMKEERLSKERGCDTLAIIPLNLDGFMFREDWQDWKKDVLISRAAPDFTDWKKDDDKFNEQVEKVIKALRADGGGRRNPPQPRL